MIKILQFPLLSSVCRSVHPSFSHVFLFHLSLTPSLPPSPPPPPHIHLPPFSLFPHRSVFPSIWCSALSISIHPSFLLCFLGSCLIFSSPFISLLPSYNLSFSVLFPFPTFFLSQFLSFDFLLLISTSFVVHTLYFTLLPPSSSFTSSRPGWGDADLSAAGPAWVKAVRRRERKREREGCKKRDSGDGKRTVESILRHKWFRLRGKREREVSNLDNMRKGWRERWWRDVMPVAGWDESVRSGAAYFKYKF